jgi:hypothetical protein
MVTRKLRCEKREHRLAFTFKLVKRLPQFHQGFRGIARRAAVDWPAA